MRPRSRRSSAGATDGRRSAARSLTSGLPDRRVATDRRRTDTRSIVLRWAIFDRSSFLRVSCEFHRGPCLALSSAHVAASPHLERLRRHQRIHARAVAPADGRRRLRRAPVAPRSGDDRRRRPQPGAPQTARTRSWTVRASSRTPGRAACRARATAASPWRGATSSCSSTTTPRPAPAGSHSCSSPTAIPASWGSAAASTPPGISTGRCGSRGSSTGSSVARTVGLPSVRSEVRNVIGANMSFRREVFDKVGGFDERHRPGRHAAGRVRGDGAVHPRAPWASVVDDRVRAGR